MHRNNGYRGIPDPFGSRRTPRHGDPRVTAVVFDDFRTLSRRILEHTFEVVESDIRDFPT